MRDANARGGAMNHWPRPRPALAAATTGTLPSSNSVFSYSGVMVVNRKGGFGCDQEWRDTRCPGGMNEYWRSQYPLPFDKLSDTLRCVGAIESLDERPPDASGRILDLSGKHHRTGRTVVFASPFVVSTLMSRCRIGTGHMRVTVARCFVGAVPEPPRRYRPEPRQSQDSTTRGSLRA